MIPDAKIKIYKKNKNIGSATIVAQNQVNPVLLPLNNNPSNQNSIVVDNSGLIKAGNSKDSCLVSKS